MIVEHKVVNKNVERVSRAGVGLIVVEYVVIRSQMAVDSLSSRLRDPAVVGTCWGGLASMRCLWPNQNTWGVVKRR